VGFDISDISNIKIPSGPPAATIMFALSNSFVVKLHTGPSVVASLLSLATIFQ